jgi:hypothetical protein
MQFSNVNEVSCKVKEVKFALEHATKAQGAWRNNCTFSLTSVPDGGGWLTPLPCRFTPWKETRYQSCRRLGGSHGVRKTSPSPGFDPRTVQLVASRSND